MLEYRIVLVLAVLGFGMLAWRVQRLGSTSQRVMRVGMGAAWLVLAVNAEALSLLWGWTGTSSLLRWVATGALWWFALTIPTRTSRQ